MERFIGIRCTPQKVFYCILEKKDSSNKILNIDHLSVPTALSIPEKLKHIRSNMLDILNEYQITKGGIRVAESNSMKLNIHRLYIEGVIQELFASSLLEDYYTGQISNISKRVGIDRSDFKDYISGKIDYQIVDGWNSYEKEKKESIFTAIGATADV